jgi:hypothetical protein
MTEQTCTHDDQDVDEVRQGCDCACDADCEQLPEEIFVHIGSLYISPSVFCTCGPDEDVCLPVDQIDDCEWLDEWIENGHDCPYNIHVYRDHQTPGCIWKMQISVFGGECGCGVGGAAGPALELEAQSPLDSWPDCSGPIGGGGAQVAFEGITIEEPCP